MSNITVELDPETMLKLKRRAARVNMTPRCAVRLIATKGVDNFLACLVAPTKRRARKIASKGEDIFLAGLVAPTKRGARNRKEVA